MPHRLTDRGKDQHYRYQCKICSDVWVRRPKSTSCPGVKIYPWRKSPPHLLTYKQLKAKHLKPRDRAKRDGCIIVRQEWCWLYNEREALPRRICSEKQLQSLAVARQKQRDKWRCEHCGKAPSAPAYIKDYYWPGLCLACKERIEWENEQADLEDMIQQDHKKASQWAKERIEWENEQADLEDMIQQDHKKASQWAKDLLARNDWVVLDTETTSLNGVVIDLAIISPTGETLLNCLINPGQDKVSPSARRIHQINDEELENAPQLPQIWPQIQAALAEKSLILTYNAAFDQAIMERSADRYGLTELEQKWDCIMEQYASWCGWWSDYHCSYTWQKLPGGSHRALGDALAALQVIRNMATGSAELGQENN